MARAASAAGTKTKGEGQRSFPLTPALSRKREKDGMRWRRYNSKDKDAGSSITNVEDDRKGQRQMKEHWTMRWRGYEIRGERASLRKRVGFQYHVAQSDSSL